MGRGAGGSSGGTRGVTRGVRWQSVSGKSAVAKEKFAGAPDKHIRSAKEIRLYSDLPKTPTGEKTQGYHARFSDTLHIYRDTSSWTYRHELGHLVSEKFLTFDQQTELENLYDSEMARIRRGVTRRGTIYFNDRWVSQYASRSPGEMFAETYAILTIPGGPNRAALQTKVETYAPNVAAFVRNVL